MDNNYESTVPAPPLGQQEKDMTKSEADLRIGLQRAAAIILKLRGCAEDEIDDAIIASLIRHELVDAETSSAPSLGWSAIEKCGRCGKPKTAHISGARGLECYVGEDLCWLPTPPSLGWSAIESHDDNT